MTKELSFPYETNETNEREKLKLSPQHMFFFFLIIFVDFFNIELVENLVM